MWGGSGPPPSAGPDGDGMSPGMRRAAGQGRRGVTARSRGAPGGEHIGDAGDVRRTCDMDLALHDRRSIPCGLWGHAPTERGAASGRAGRGARHERTGPRARRRTVVERAAPGEPGRSHEVTVRTRPGRSGRLAFGTPLTMIRERAGGHAGAPSRPAPHLSPDGQAVSEPEAVATDLGGGDAHAVGRRGDPTFACEPGRSRSDPLGSAWTGASSPHPNAAEVVRIL